MSKDRENLFSEFPPISTQQWENEIVKDLKGADYAKKLYWNTENDFVVNPYYRAENVEKLNYLSDNEVSKSPFVRTQRDKDNNWLIVQTVYETQPAKANAILQNALKNGANSLCINVSEIRSIEDLSILLKNVNIENTPLRFFAAKNYVHFAKIFIDYIRQNQIDTSKIKGAFSFDPLAYFLLHNSFYRTYESDFEEILQLLEIMSQCPDFACITINAGLLHNCGANIKQELGYGLAIAEQYLNYVTDKGIDIEQIANKIHFEFAISSDYFLEIAKLRAVRLLWANIVKAYQYQDINNLKMHIFARSSRWDKTIFDPYVNMLRTTTEGMSAAIGGADSIDLEPFNAIYQIPDEFSMRIARNTQIILQEESAFGKVIDPAGGSYYIENLTNSIAEQSWNAFLEIQQQGGMLEAAQKGFIQQNIEKTCRKRDMELATRKKILLGTNQYPNINEEMLTKISIHNTLKNNGLQLYRGAAAFEELRLKTEQKAAKTGKRPTVFLLKTGNVAMRQARAGFITNFFGCAGYQITEGAFEATEDAVNAACEAKADIVVICSADDEYIIHTPLIINLLKEKLPIAFCLIAGYPVEHIDALTTAGVFDFIHIKCNLLETLKKYNQLLKIE
ncbi:MAG: methylmalonyl-CoA mutase subunit beta [Bacteroidales bacterium]|jgi:methylmalonyl-CoA mutase|nr:methylmalonyl-CoA mutase subunit beta [Bacteroidales bacterium]